MQDRIVGAALGGARLVLLVAALVVALVPIGRSAVTGFCPPVAAVEDASGTGGADVASGVAPGMLVLAAPALLAEAVEPDATTSDGTPAPGATDGVAPTDGATDGAPTDGATGAEDGGDAAACPDGASRCLPPLVSAVVSFGSGPCGGEALSLLRGSMLPAFLLSTALLAGAWLLRPRHGHGVFSRF